MSIIGRSSQKRNSEQQKVHHIATKRNTRLELVQNMWGLDYVQAFGCEEIVADPGTPSTASRQE